MMETAHVGIVKDYHHKAQEERRKAMLHSGSRNATDQWECGSGKLRRRVDVSK